MTRAQGCTAVVAILIGVSVFLPAVASQADVVTPPAACTATGQFVSAGLTYSSTQFVPASIVPIPQTDTVNWQGHEDGKPIGYTGPTRPIDGAVTIKVPFGIGVTIWHWGGTMSPRYSNSGQEVYSLPSALIGVKLLLSGYEKDSGALVCSGQVYVEVEGSKAKNPAGWGALGVAALSLILMLGAGFRKSRLAYDDLNP